MKKPEVIDGMKGRFMGEFTFTTEEPCPVCALYLDEHYDDIECLCGGSDEKKYRKEIVVPWGACKNIYQEMTLFAAKQG